MKGKEEMYVNNNEEIAEDVVETVMNIAVNGVSDIVDETEQVPNVLSEDLAVEPSNSNENLDQTETDTKVSSKTEPNIIKARKHSNDPAERPDKRVAKKEESGLRSSDRKDERNRKTERKTNDNNKKRSISREKPGSRSTSRENASNEATGRVVRRPARKPLSKAEPTEKAKPNNAKRDRTKTNVTESRATRRSLSRPPVVGAGGAKPSAARGPGESRLKVSVVSADAEKGEGSEGGCS